MPSLEGLTDPPDAAADAEARLRAEGRAWRQTAGAPPRVVVLGAGFGGLAAAKALRRAPVAVTIIDRQNHHLFQPLLYQVATAALAPSDIAMPIRSIFRGHRNVAVVMDVVTGVDPAARVVQCRRGNHPYDYLIVATGAEYNYFGHDDWRRQVPALKTLADAIAIRRKVLYAFEAAETIPDEQERTRLTTFVIVGGGPTGVEMAGALAELAKRVLAGEFRTVEPRRATIMLIEAGPTLLAGFPPPLADYARRELERKGVTVLLNAPVRDIGGGMVMAGERVIASENVFWAAGVRVGGLGEWLRAGTDPIGRVKVLPDLSLPGRPEVFVIGDAAHAAARPGEERPLPGVAPVAKQEGEYVGAVIARAVTGHEPQPAFHYRDAGMLATIGRGAAVADLPWVRLKGFLAWLLWGAVHVWTLIGFRNRLAVFLNWAWAYVTYGLGARVIVRPEDAIKEEKRQP